MKVNTNGGAEIGEVWGEEHFQSLRTAFRPMVRALARGLVPASHVDDVEQETWMRLLVLLRRKPVRPESAGRLINMIARTKAIDYGFRLETHQVVRGGVGLEEEGVLATIPDPAPTPEEAAMVGEAVRLAGRARLSPLQREVVESLVEDERPVEVAARLGISRQAVHQAHRRALARIREAA